MFLVWMNSQNKYFSAQMLDHLLVFVVVTVCSVLFYTFVKKKRLQSELRNKIRQRRDERANQFAKIEEYCSTLSEDRASEISQWSFSTLREKLQSGYVSCEEVLKSYQKKALSADEKTNCICLFIEEGIRTAQSLDKQAESSEYVKPALFGIPVSIKESFQVKGMDCTYGFAQGLFKPSARNSNIVEQLLNLGAVPFVHTNVPMSLKTYGCTNAIYGTTGNPLDKNRGSGGSSSGEAALIAEGGSILGIGSDIGGSIRIPATFCGISGFKPSTPRFAHVGDVIPLAGQLVRSNAGPMAPHIDICIEYLKMVWNDNFHSKTDPYCPPISWQDNLFTSEEPLTIGYYTNDNFIKAAPANERVVLECVKFLESLGHKVVSFEVPYAQRSFELFFPDVVPDGGRYLTDKMNKDIVLPESDFNFICQYLPVRVQRIIGKLLPWPRVGRILQAQPVNCTELCQNIAEIKAYRTTFVQRMKEQGIDVIVCPAMSIYPTEHDVPSKFLAALHYTALYNLLDFAAGVVPVTKVTEKDDVALEEYPENDPFDRTVKKQCKGLIGFPVGVQVAAPPYMEEKALRVLKQLNDASF